MSIADQKKLDFLWKKIMYGVTETTASKDGSNESIGSPLPVFGNQVWAQADQIPTAAPATDTTVVVVQKGAKAIKCVADPTVSGNKTWIAVVSSTGNPMEKANRITDWIPPSVDPSYMLKVYKGIPSAGGVVLNALTNNEEWVFDYQAGVLHFPNNLPNGVVDIYIEGCRYIGTKGVGSGGTNSGDPSSVGDMIGIPTDGLWSNGRVEGSQPAIQSWTAATRIVDALDDLNEILGLLVPAPPAPLSSKTLVIEDSISGLDGANVVICDGVINNSGSVPLAGGTPVTAVASGEVTSLPVTNFGPGNSGDVQAIINGNIAGVVTLGSGDNVTTDGALTIIDNPDFPADKPGFHKSLTAGIATTVQAGLNSMKMLHTASGETNEVLFVVDEVIEVPSATFNTIAPSLPNIVHSSGIPHYTENSTLTASVTGFNLSTNVFYDKGVMEISTEPVVGDPVFIDPGQYNLPAVLPSHMPTYSQSGLEFVVSGDVHTEAEIRTRVRLPLGNSPWAVAPKKLLIMSGEPAVGLGGVITETNVKVDPALGEIPADAVAHAMRVNISHDEDTPVVSTGEIGLLLSAPWEPAREISSAAASVVGGVLKHDLTDYTQYLPEGPDFSTRPPHAPQYATFMLRRRACSSIKIHVEGTYAGMWVMLPGIQGLNNTLNGWWDLYRRYDGIGVPDRGVNSPGCAFGTPANGTSGRFIAFFGEETSSNSVNSAILVRFRLAKNQAITGLEIN
jgi:hypothetical protein